MEFTPRSGGFPVPSGGRPGNPDRIVDEEGRREAERFSSRLEAQNIGVAWANARPPAARVQRIVAQRKKTAPLLVLPFTNSIIAEIAPKIPSPSM